MKQERLFDVTSIPLTNGYISPSDKKKWTLAFRKWCNEKYDCGETGVFCCGSMSICDHCAQKIGHACDDCVEAIKTVYKNQHKEVPYKNYNFQEILDEVEK